MTHTVKGFGVVSKAEIDVFLELSCFFDNPTDVGLPYFLLRQGFFLLFVFAMIIPLRSLLETLVQFSLLVISDSMRPHGL